MKEKKIFVFGYGTLMYLPSISKTLSTDAPVAASISGFKRGWYFKDLREKRMALGLKYSTGENCNGVLLKLKESDFSDLDLREKGYSRVLLKNTDIENVELTDNDSVYTYIVEKIDFPTLEYPIAQTYLDVCLEGALKFGPKYSSDFILNTDFWNYPWVNDRQNPIFKRGFNDLSVSLIDELLEKNIKLAFSNRI